MSLTKNFTQGGQVTLHNLRMIKQVLSVTLGTTFLISLLFFCFKTWQDHTPYQRQITLTYMVAHLKTALPFGDINKRTQTFVYEDGKKQKVRSVDVLEDPWMNQEINHISDMMISNAFKALWMFLISTLSFILFWMWQGKKKEESQLLKGVSIQSPKIVKKIITKRGAADINLAGIPMPKETDKEHTMICGTTGAGKTNAINNFINQLKEQDCKTLIVDTTGNYIANFYNEKKDYLLNPFDDRYTYWNLWSEAVDDYEYLEFADSLIPVKFRQDEFWINASRQLLTVGITTLKEENNFSIKELLNFLVVLPLDQAHKKLSHTLVSAYLDPKNEKTALSIRASMIASLWSLQYLGKPSKDSEFSIRKWCEDDKDRGWLFLAAQPTQRSILQPLLSGWLSIAVKSLMARGEHKTRRLWFIMDELASINHLPTLERGLAEVRKCGGCFLIGFQDINQLFKIYGQYDAQTILGLLGTQVVMRSQRKQADALSQCFGNKEVIEQARSISFGANDMRDGVSLSEHLREKPVISPTDIMMLDKGEAYVRFNGNFPYTKIKFPLASIKVQAPSFIRNPLLSERQAKQDLDQFKQEHDLEVEGEKNAE